MRYSLGFVLALSLAGLQFLAILFVVSTSYISSERAMLEHARGLLGDARLTAVEHTNGFLEPAREAAELSSRMIEAGIVDANDPTALETFLFEHLQTETQLSGIFYGDAAGNFTYVMRSDGPGPYRTKFIANDPDNRVIELLWREEDGTVAAREFDPEDTFDPRERRWYVDAAAARASVWTDPYIFFSSQQPGITVAAPVLSAGNRVSGVVGVDIEIADISTFLSQLSIGEQGLAVILNENADVIAHPNFADIADQAADGTVDFVNVHEISDPVTRAAFAGFDQTADLSDEVVQSGFEYAGEAYLTLLGPMTGTSLPWIISVFVPENDFIQGIKDNRRRNIWIAALISLLSAIAGVTLAELILRPVRAFAVRTSLVSQGEVSAHEPLPGTYQELRDANQTLISEIAKRRELDARNQDLNRELSHATRVNMMGQMATGLAHELSQPLTAITQNVDTAISLAQQDPDNPTELLRVLSELDEQAHQGGDIIRSLRGFVRKDTNTPARFALPDLIAQTCRLMRHEATEHDVTIASHVGDLPEVLGNRVGIAQVLTNLLRNAIEAMSSADSERREVTISAQQDGEYVRVSVADTGPGIASDLVLFKQFQTSKPDGLGLGLSISRTIAEANGGRLWYKTDGADGTTFFFTVPIDGAQT